MRLTEITETFEIGDNRFKIVRINLRRIIDETNVQELGNELRTYLAEPDSPDYVEEISDPTADYCLDFSDVEYNSSASMGKLITANKLHKGIRDDRRISLSGLRPEIYQVFAMTDLKDYFHIHENTEAYESEMRKAMAQPH